MSALDSMQRVFAELGIDTAEEVLSAGDPDTFQQRQMKHFLEQSGRDIIQRAEWPSLYFTYDIPGGVDELKIIDFGIAPYQDFRTFGTGANVVTNLGPARVILNPTTWGVIREGIFQNEAFDSPYVFIDGSTTLRSTANLRQSRVGYYSWGWVNHGVTRSRYITSDADTFRVPDHVVELGAVWRWMRAKGLPYEGQLREYEAEIAVNARNAKAAV